MQDISVRFRAFYIYDIDNENKQALFKLLAQLQCLLISYLMFSQLALGTSRVNNAVNGPGPGPGQSYLGTSRSIVQENDPISTLTTVTVLTVVSQYYGV